MKKYNPALNSIKKRFKGRKTAAESSQDVIFHSCIKFKNFA